MTLAEVIALINSDIVPNGNNEITANVLRPILIEMLQQPNDLIGELDELNTVENDTLVKAINSVNNALSDVDGLTILSGQGDPNQQSFPSLSIADLYSEIDGLGSPLALWIYDGTKFIRFSDKYLSYEIPQALTVIEQLTARSNIGATDRRLDELASDLTASEKGIIQDKLGIEDTDLTGLLTNPTYDSDTHIFTMDVIGGSQFQIDFPIEALITNVDLDDDNNLVITFEDGSEVLVPLNTLLVGVVKTVNGKNPNSQGVVTINIDDVPNLQDELDNKADKENVVPYEGATQNVNLGNQNLSLYGSSILNGLVRYGSSEIQSKWMDAGNLSSTDNVSWIIIEGFTAYTNRQLSIEVETVSGNGARAVITKRFVVDFSSSNYVIENYSEYTRVEGQANRYGIGSLEKHSNTALKIPIIYIASAPRLAFKVKVKAFTGSVTNLEFDTILESGSPLTADFPINSYLDYNNFINTPTNLVSQSSLNTQLANYVTTNGVQNITATKTFTIAPIVPNGTLNGHTVNLGQLNDVLGEKADIYGSNTTGGSWNIDNLINDKVGLYVETYSFDNGMIGIPSTNALGSADGILLMRDGAPIAITENNKPDWDGYIYRTGTPKPGYPGNQQNGNYLIESKHRFRLHAINAPDSTSGNVGSLQISPFNAIEHNYFRVTISGVERLDIFIKEPYDDEITGFNIERNAIGQKCTVAVSGGLTGITFANVSGFNFTSEWNKGVFDFYWTGTSWIFGGYSPIEP